MPGGRVRVDETDLRILQTLFVGGDYFHASRIPADAVGRALGVHRQTVATRIKRLAEGGFFLPATLEVEPGALGLVGAKAFLPVPRERRTQEALTKLFLLDGLQGVVGYLDGWDVLIYAEDEEGLTARLGLAKALTGATEATLDIHTSRDYPPFPAAKLTKLDARLIGALLEDARAPFPKLARLLGVTPRTLERRYERLREEGVVMLLPGALGPFEGLLLAYVRVELPPEGKTREKAVNALLGLFPDHLMRNVATLGRAHLLVWARALPDLETRLEGARAIPGVTGLAYRLMTEGWISPAYRPWLARLVARRSLG